MSSEVARFRAQYELEYQAAKRGLEGVAMVAAHQFITKRMENMWEQFQQLVQVVGQAEAHEIAFGKSREIIAEVTSEKFQGEQTVTTLIGEKML